MSMMSRSASDIACRTRRSGAGGGLSAVIPSSGRDMGAVSVRYTTTRPPHSMRYPHEPPGWLRLTPETRNGPRSNGRPGRTPSKHTCAATSRMRIGW